MMVHAKCLMINVILILNAQLENKDVQMEVVHLQELVEHLLHVL